MDLPANNLGVLSDNLNYLGHGMKNLPSNLNYLHLNLSNNNLGGNPANM